MVDMTRQNFAINICMRMMGLWGVS